MMDHKRCFRFIVLALVLASTLSLSLCDPARAQGSVLVLYDSTGEWGWVGQLDVQHLTNLLSHFAVQVHKKPVEEYSAGEINLYRTTIYLGALSDTPLPSAFRSDILTTTKTVCWLGNNLEQVALNTSGTDNPAFIEKFGVRFLGLDSSLWSAVNYKQVTLTRETAEPEIGLLQIVDPSKVQVYATCSTADLTKEAPYITRAGNLWYVADNPMGYVTMTDRYLAFADVLHDILNISHPESHRAHLRIEDVTPIADPVMLRAIADYLYSQDVPFLISVVPEYRDPLGIYNYGEAISLADRPEVVDALHYMVAHGGQIVLHGLTHQYDAIANPYNGVSGTDYEFFLVALDSTGLEELLLGPVPEDTPAWARGRVMQGKDRLARLNFNPVAWNTPHYLASVIDYQEFAKLFPISVDRGAYFATDALGKLQCSDQIAPYILEKDVYGIKRLPENIGYISPLGWIDEPPSLPADLLHRAELNKVVRDGWASCYFHWFLDLNYLKELVPGLKNQGYQFYRLPTPWTGALFLLLLDDSAGGLPVN